MNGKPATRVVAIIPAAGAGRRMGAVKQLLDVDGRPLIELTVKPFLLSEAAAVVLVTRAEVARLIRPHPNLLIVVPDGELPEMIDSVRVGLRISRQHPQCVEASGFMICPGDHPGIQTADINRCLAAFRAGPQQVVIAARGGRRGHPIVFPAADAAFVESAACDSGLHALPRAFSNRVALVECASEGVERDIDRPDDLDRFRTSRGSENRGG